MATIKTINATDLITDSRADINDNFSALNSDKIETSYLDTDNTLAANSDVKIPSQKAVKAYVDAGGNVNASTTSKGIVEEATQAEVTAGTDTGGTGAKLFVPPSKLNTQIDDKISAIPSAVFKSGSTTYDLATESGTQTIAHGLGAKPKRVKITAIVSPASAPFKISIGSYVASSNNCIWGHYAVNSSGANLSGNESSYTIKIYNSSADIQVGAVTVDATNITITWTKSGTPTGTAYLLWEVE